MVTKPVGVSSPAAEGQQEAGSDPAQDSSLGHRKQLTVTMAGKKVPYFCSVPILHQSKVSLSATCCYSWDAALPLQGKRVVSEKPEKKPVSGDMKSPADDGQAKSAESPGRRKQPPHVSKTEPLVQVWIRASEHSKHDQCAPSARTLSDHSAAH